MPKIEVQKIIRVPREKAVEYFGDIELYNSLHPREDTSYTILSRKNNEVLLEVKQEIGGRVFNYTNRTVFRLPDRVESETLSGVAKGSRQVITLEAVAEGTRVTYTSDVRIDFSVVVGGGVVGKAMRMVSGKMMKKLTRESLEQMAEVDRKYLEGEQSQPSDAE